MTATGLHFKLATKYETAGSVFATELLSLNFSSQPSQQWFLLYCKPRQELRAQQHLANQNYNSFLPQIRLQKLRGDSWCSVTEPLFPRYLFLHLPPEQELNMRAIRATRGISDFVRFGNQLARVPDQLVQLLTQQQITLQQQSKQAPLQPGDAVKVLSGPFAGLEAVFTTADGEKRSIILVHLLGQWVATTLENRAITAKTTP